MKKISFFFISLVALNVNSFAKEYKWLGEWLKDSNPIVANYLLDLKDGQIGTQLKGVRLLDDSMQLKGYWYLGKIKSKYPFVHMYKFRYQYKGSHFESVYIWNQENGKSVKIHYPECEGKPLEPFGKVFFVLSGDTYTFMSVSPGELVLSICRVNKE